MAQEIRKKLGKQTSTPGYIYGAKSFTSLHIFDSKQYMYNTINILHKTLDDCPDLGVLYLDSFFLSLDLLETETENIYILNLNQIKALVQTEREL